MAYGALAFITIASRPNRYRQELFRARMLFIFASRMMSVTGRHWSCCLNLGVKPGDSMGNVGLIASRPGRALQRPLALREDCRRLRLGRYADRGGFVNGVAVPAVRALLLAGLISCSLAPRGPHAPGGLADWHTHLSLESPGSLDSLYRNGVTVVRDCGGNLDSLLRWRQRIRDNAMVGPRLVIAGPLIDGPKPGAPFRLTIVDDASATAAVDSLAARGVDFLKVHNAVPPAAFFTLLQRARAHGLAVAVHLPRGVTAWSAVDSGATSIEHAAESLVASPIYAGLARTPAEAVAWWRSPSADSILAVWAARKVVIVPTLVRYEATVGTAPDSLRAQRAALLPDLVALVGRMHRAGVRIAAGTDVAGVVGAAPTWRALRRELELLTSAGLNAVSLRSATAPSQLDEWLSSGGAARHNDVCC